MRDKPDSLQHSLLITATDVVLKDGFLRIALQVAVFCQRQDCRHSAGSKGAIRQLVCAFTIARPFSWV
jgi:hypothetical protein